MITTLFTILLLLTACRPATEETAVTPNNTGMMGGGMGGGMMARHHATIPTEYAGLTNPVTADDDSLARGAEIYTTHCASCHGDGGMGDGPAAATLDPAPAAIAHTSQMLGDDYLFWRVSEGGQMAPFNSTMVAWKAILDEDGRWDVLNYIQALGQGTVTPGSNVGGAPFDPAAEQAQRAIMLADAVAQGVITQAEADTFALVHVEIDAQMGSNSHTMSDPNSGSMTMDSMLASMVATAVAEGTITQADADLFLTVHEQLIIAGLMQ
jgi:mono/diheme cytochrome c family protein